MAGLLIALSGPSGVGKGTIYRELLSRMDNLHVSVSATTRAPRPGEIDGQHYFFLSREKFLDMVKKGDFLEYAETVGNLYGTPREAVLKQLGQGKNVMLEIDVKGVKQVKRSMGGCLTIFVLPPSDGELERRLRGRKTETEEQLASRLALAKRELLEAEWFDYRVVNDDLNETVDEIINIINSEQKRRTK